MVNTIDTGPDSRIEWIEPEVRSLAIVETSILDGTGNDGETIWTDCSLS